MNVLIPQINTPAISIITVTYNAFSVLEATIKSVITQDFKFYEYIIIDGGSTDGTAKTIKNYESYLTYWISEPDNGIYDAMNKGLKMAKGSYIYFLNAGDEFIHQNVLSGIEGFLINTDANIICGKVLLTDDLDRKKIIGTNPKFKVDNLNFRKLLESSFCHQALFVKREAYMNVGGFELSYKVFSDFNTMAKILKLGKSVLYIDYNISYYDTNGVSGNWRNVRKLENEKEEILYNLDDKINFVKSCFRKLKVEIFIIRKKAQYAWANKKN